MSTGDPPFVGQDLSWSIGGKWEEVSTNSTLKEQIDRLEQNMEKVMERLAILEDPTPEQLEQFKTLQDAYKKYKFVEGLCGKEEE